MLKKLIVLSLLPLSVSAKDLAVAPNGMMGLTVLTNESCAQDKNLYVSYVYLPTNDVIYSCWKLVGTEIQFMHSVKKLTTIPLDRFVEIKKDENRKKNLL